ncbi:Asp23/Gls24 family envelope stress response protein [Rothia sp. P6271]|uniref:Asp23/Gls24 family envelope stress response protein n=1 Tax=unclassified Rothia (in: high G+C Gram-positive bacteria) TaxID=2689056 RepID=UPI003ABEC342
MSDCRIPLSVLSDWLDDEHENNETVAHRKTTEHIDQCPVCTQRVKALRKLGTLTAELSEHDLKEQNKDTSWIDTLLNNIALETKAGRSIPLRSDNEFDRLTQTEGSVISAIRSAADELEDVVIGKCHLDGDVTVIDSPITVNVTASIRFGTVIDNAAEELRTLILKEIERISELNVQMVNVTIQDIFDAAQTQHTRQKKTGAWGMLRDEAAFEYRKGA